MAKEQMSKYKAEQLLGLSGRYDKKHMNSAYRAKAKQNHPDISGDKQAAQAKMADINNAKVFLDKLFAATDSIYFDCDSQDYSSGVHFTSNQYTKTSTPHQQAKNHQEDPQAKYRAYWAKKDAQKTPREPNEYATNFNANATKHNNGNVDFENSTNGYVVEETTTTKVKVNRQHKTGNPILDFIVHIFSVDWILKIAFVFLAVSIFNYVNTTPSISNEAIMIGWAMYPMAFINLFVPFITRPFRKLVLMILKPLTKN